MKNKLFAVSTLYAWLLFFSLLPLALVVVASFLSHDSNHLLQLPFTVNNVTNLFSYSFLRIFIRSLWVASLSTAICLLFAYPFSYLLVRARYQSLLLLLVIIPFWSSALVRTYSLMAILKTKGLLNLLLMKLHIIHTPIPWLYSNFAVILGLSYNLFPFMLLPIFTNMERFDFRLMDAARDLGASHKDRFFKVFFPNTLSGVASGCLLVFLPAMTLFYIPNVLGGARSVLLGNLIQDQFLINENWPQGAATCLILSCFFIIILMLFRRHNRLELHR